MKGLKADQASIIIFMILSSTFIRLPTFLGHQHIESRPNGQCGHLKAIHNVNVPTWFNRGCPWSWESIISDKSQSSTGQSPLSTWALHLAMLFLYQKQCYTFKIKFLFKIKTINSSHLNYIYLQTDQQVQSNRMFYWPNIYFLFPLCY